MPSLPGCRQFRFGILALWKQKPRAGMGKRRGVTQKPIKWGERPGSDDILWRRGAVLDPDILDPDREIEPPGTFSQKGGLARVGFDKRERNRIAPPDGKNGTDNAGKPGAAAKVEPGSCPRRGEGEKLGAVKNMSLPQVVEGRSRHQIDPAIPVLQKALELPQALFCFT